MAKPTAETVARFEELCELVPEAQPRMMFGCPSRMANGYAFLGAHSSGVFVKLPADVGEELVADGGGYFEPMPGRRMGGFYLLPEGDAGHWVRRARDYVSGLPPKPVKKK